MGYDSDIRFLKRFDITVYVGKSLEKILLFWTIPRLKIGAILLVISLIVTLIKDEIDKSLVLFLNCCVFDDVLILHNAKKRYQYISE